MRAVGRRHCRSRRARSAVAAWAATDERSPALPRGTRGRKAAPKRLPRLASVLVLGSVLAVGAGCSTPEQRYHVLRFFFDGVPPPESVLAAIERQRAADGTPVADAAKRLRPRPKLKLLHEPFADDACDDCHDGRSGNQLIAKGADLCGSCHDLEDFAGAVMHGPMAAGACTQCHDPHKSDHDALLRFEASVLCGTCHDATTFDEGERHRAERGADCLRCHNPHATDRQYMLEPDVDLS